MLEEIKAPVNVDLTVTGLQYMIMELGELPVRVVMSLKHCRWLYHLDHVRWMKLEALGYLPSKTLTWDVDEHLPMGHWRVEGATRAVWSPGV